MVILFCFKQKTAYEVRISDWSSDVCSSDLFDRSAIIDLIGTMDDAIDQMNATGKSIELYELTSFEPQMRDMTGIIVEAARVTAEAIPLLRRLGPNAQRLHELTSRLIPLEGPADEIHEAGLKAVERKRGE